MDRLNIRLATDKESIREPQYKSEVIIQIEAQRWTICDKRHRENEEVKPSREF